MKNKVIVIAGVVTLILIAGFIRFRAQQSLVTPQPLPTPKETPTPSEMSPQDPTPTSLPTAAAQKITLTITSPKNGATVTNASIKVQGKTAANAEVFVNEKETKADKNGSFSVSLTLDEGENYIIVMANDEEGNVAEAELTVTYDTGS